MEVGRDEGEGRPPPWAGAPGYMPHVELPPHAPMPGAPPYPARPEPSRPTVGTLTPARTSPWAVLAAAAGWAAVDLVLVLLIGSPAVGPGFFAGLAVTLVLATAATWVVARRRRWSVLVLVLLTGPAFFVLRAVVGALLG